MLLRCIAAVLLLTLAASGAAQPYPSRAIRFVVPYPPGGLTDVLARVISPKLAESFGQPVLVENRGGGGSTIGSDLVAKSAPDGHTLLLVAADLAINPSLLAKLPYDTGKDFAPVTQVAWGPQAVVVHPSLPVNSIRELLAYAKSAPRPLNYASGGNGTGAHLATELFKTMAGIQMVHVPYKGVGPATSDLLGGQVSLMFLQLAIAKPHIAAGKLRALAIAGAQRSQAVPELPTVAEAGVPGFDVNPWFGVVTRAESPREAVAKLSAEIARVMRLADVRERIAGQGAEIATSTPEEFAAFIKSEMVKWAKVVKDSGARVD
jgi:tripartite-type tricarboxylate transporter receptor subunit TctC